MKQVTGTTICKWSSDIMQNFDTLASYKGYVSKSRIYKIVEKMAEKASSDIQYHIGYTTYNDMTKTFSHRYIEEQEFTR